MDKQTSQYIENLKNFPTLPKTKQKELFLQYQESRDPQIKNRLINSNLQLVVFCIQKWNGVAQYIDMDLIQEGNMGLMTAIERFEPDRNVSFSTYAMYWIQYHVRKHLLKSRAMVGQAVGLLAQHKFRFSSIDDLTAEDENELAHDPEIDQALDDHNQWIMMQCAINQLGNTERFIAQQVVSKRMVQHQAAQQLGVSKGKLQKMQQQVVDKLKGKLL
jgi:RNA polymerase sigma factor (sigma-70 family)